VVRHARPTEAVEIREIDTPEVAAGSVRIAVSTASLNYGDIARCRGGVASVMAQPPFTLGMDVCGTVDAVAAGFEHLIGRRVVGITTMAMGGVADYALAPAASVFDAPPPLDDAHAAALTLPFHVSYLALVTRAKVQPGETVLVTAGASAVGSAAIQLAVAAGARVIALAGGAAKGELCGSLGAAASIDYTTEDVFDRVMVETDGRGVDVAVDLVGGAQTETIWTCMAREGRYLPVGFNDDPESGLTGRPLRKVSMANISVLGVLLSYNDVPLAVRKFGLNPFPPSTGAAVHAALSDLVKAGKIYPLVGQTIPIEEVGNALEAHERRATTGRTVVDLHAHAHAHATEADDGEETR
jgi:NADPH2:quinone reductase